MFRDVGRGDHLERLHPLCPGGHPAHVGVAVVPERGYLLILGTDPVAHRQGVGLARHGDCVIGVYGERIAFVRAFLHVRTSEQVGGISRPRPDLPKVHHRRQVGMPGLRYGHGHRGLVGGYGVHRDDACGAVDAAGAPGKLCREAPPRVGGAPPVDRGLGGCDVAAYGHGAVGMARHRHVLLAQVEAEGGGARFPHGAHPVGVPLGAVGVVYVAARPPVMPLLPCRAVGLGSPGAARGGLTRGRQVVLLDDAVDAHGGLRRGEHAVGHVGRHLGVRRRGVGGLCLEGVARRQPLVTYEREGAAAAVGADVTQRAELPHGCGKFRSPCGVVKKVQAYEHAVIEAVDFVNEPRTLAGDTGVPGIEVEPRLFHHRECLPVERDHVDAAPARGVDLPAVNPDVAVAPGVLVGIPVALDRYAPRLPLQRQRPREHLVVHPAVHGHGDGEGALALGERRGHVDAELRGGAVVGHAGVGHARGKPRQARRKRRLDGFRPLVGDDAALGVPRHGLLGVALEDVRLVGECHRHGLQVFRIGRPHGAGVVAALQLDAADGVGQVSVGHGIDMHACRVLDSAGLIRGTVIVYPPEFCRIHAVRHLRQPAQAHYAPGVIGREHIACRPRRGEFPPYRYGAFLPVRRGFRQPVGLGGVCGACDRLTRFQQQVPGVVLAPVALGPGADLGYGDLVVHAAGGAAPCHGAVVAPIAP